MTDSSSDRSPREGDRWTSPETERGSRANGNGRSSGVAGFLARLIGRGGEAGLRESLEDALGEGGDHSLKPEERTMLLNVLALRTMRVDDVMVPRADIVAVEEDASLDDVLALFEEEAHSRVPIYRRTLDHPVGIVHIKDLIPYVRGGGLSSGKTFALNRLRREVLFVPPSMPVVDLLLKMQTTRIHLAIVVDEYGGTDGLVTIEDLVEQIVGEIEDEHDEDEEPMVISRPDGTFEADARTPIEEFEPLVGIDLVPHEKEEDVDTLGGLVFSLAGRVPQRGEVISHEGGLEFEVVDADPRRIKRLVICRSTAEGASGTAADPDAHPGPESDGPPVRT